MYYDIAIAIFAVYGILAIHELGHLVVARAFGIRTFGLTLGVGPKLVGFRCPLGVHWTIAALPIGSSCKLSAVAGAGPDNVQTAPAGRALADTSIGERAAIYAAGPVMNICVAVGLIGARSWSNGEFSLSWIERAEATTIALIAGISILIGLFNLLPILPLDGGVLALLALEARRGKPLSRRSESHFRTVGQGLITAASVSIAILFALRYWHLI
ncbi:MULTISPECIES: site-2 protease family protein [Rhodopseudomonas]|uniref:Peptidase M50 domain-containing protein n=1 Tax=Rhodopseudomonas palustris TaxID=1076 RepID=A0A0D7E7W2_RHOPL|nr:MULTISPECIES: site-2 protease family protein [Rhodopseudomonas]KIZ36585.1 hypothetical protein OO17_24560 [Rhodopseudomonas palustris]MDF3813698.1 site-2 protease family protein [Rhodopseudomonas sp. BAL398]WOK19814.1 site-2 protease family protein [Rhodopseudomonas sp. BAL398]